MSFPERRRVEDTRRMLTKQEIDEAKAGAPGGANPQSQNQNPFPPPGT
jgi:hypothetical protein